MLLIASELTTGHAVCEERWFKRISHEEVEHCKLVLISMYQGDHQVEWGQPWTPRVP